MVARELHKILCAKLRSHGGYRFGVGGIEAEHDLVPGVGVDPGADAGGQLPPVLVREGEAKPQPPRLCQSVGEVGGKREIVLQLVVPTQITRPPDFFALFISSA